jgi:hypothetical protein
MCGGGRQERAGHQGDEGDAQEARADAAVPGEAVDTENRGASTPHIAVILLVDQGERWIPMKGLSHLTASRFIVRTGRVAPRGADICRALKT